MADSQARAPAPTARAFLIGAIAFFISVQAAFAAPFASFVMDARTGQVLEATNADTRLHPASLTKMMTLYITFAAIKKGEISLDTDIRISAKAANEPPSRLGMKAGSTIKLRYCIRAAAIKSANDCATAIAEALAGSEAAFARRMNQMAKAMGMRNTTFKVAHGLTTPGHLSTARDMSILGRHLLYDHPEYYNLFSRRSADAGGRSVRSTNARFLDAYEGADGIKTGYTAAAGFNMTASAQRGDIRIIATVFGGTSTAARNEKIRELLDLGFKRAPASARLQRPKVPFPAPAVPADTGEDVIAAAVAGSVVVARPGLAAKTLRVSGAVTQSPRPHWRPGPALPAPPPDLLAAMEDGISESLDAVVEERKATAPTDEAPLASVAAPPRPLPEGEAAAVAVESANPLPEVLAAADDPDAGLVPGIGTEAAAPVSPEAAVIASEAVAPAAAAEGDVALAEAPPVEPTPATLPDPPPEVVLADASAAPPPATSAPAPAEGDALAGAPPLPDAIAAVASETELAALVPPPDGESADPAFDDREELALLAEADEAGATYPAVQPATAAGLPQPPRAAPDVPKVDLAALEPEVFDATGAEPQVVTRLSTSGGRHWGINVGSYDSQYAAERVLLTTALKEIGTLGEAGRKVNRTKTGFDANFVGMSHDMADLACRRLIARNVHCTVLGS